MYRVPKRTSTVAFGLAAFACTCAPAFAGTAFTVYGAVADGAGGYGLIRFPPGAVIAPLPHALVAGAFLPGDDSTEYAIDDQSDLVAVDTTNGEVASIGPPGFSIGLHDALAADPSTGLVYALDARGATCSMTNTWSIDTVSGHATLIGGGPGCLQSMAIDPPPAGIEGGRPPLSPIYYLDRDANAVRVGGTLLGPLGLELNDTSTIAIPPGTHDLLLFQFDGTTTDIYAVDTTSGAATPIGALGGDAPISALALAPPLPDAIFTDGFDPT